MFLVPQSTRIIKLTKVYKQKYPRAKFIKYLTFIIL